MDMTTEERAWDAAVRRMQGDSIYALGYKDGATEQEAIDHSEEHLNWIIKQYHLWSYEMCHCDNNECCTFKEWIAKAKEGEL